MNDYFINNAVYKKEFRRRFRMRKELFLRITNEVSADDSYFAQKNNAAGKMGLAPLQETTAALRFLAYVLYSRILVFPHFVL